MAAAHLNGVELAYQQMGEGPDLVMVHGLAASRAFWFLQYAMPLSQHFRVTLFDLRGHGYSSRPESGYDAISLADDLGGLLDHLNIAHCALVGHSYGGGVALEFAGRQPARVDRLAIMDTKVNRVQPEQRLADSPYLSPFEKALAARSEYNWETEPQLGLLFLEVLARQRVASGNASRDTAVGDGENSARDAFTPFGEGRGALRTARQWVDLLDHTQARSEFLMAGMEAEAIAALPMPIFLAYGGVSRCLPSCHALQKLLPATQVEIIADGGHFFPQSHAAQVLPLLSEFLLKPAAKE